MNFHQHTEKIFTVEEFLSQEESKGYIELSENIGYELAKINTHKGQRVMTQVRNNNRSFYTSEDLAGSLWEKAKPFIPEKIGNSQAIGLNELFRFYRYQPGQQFRGHYDESFIRNSTEASYVTFMIYLNDDFEGGQTIFSDVWIKPKQGTLLIFMHDLFHEGREVTKGIKYVLRTDVMYKLKEE